MADKYTFMKNDIEKISQFYESKRSYLMVNGSTGAILAVLSAAFCKGDKILVARNMQSAVHNAIQINQFTPIYLNSKSINIETELKMIEASLDRSINGIILPEDIEEIIRFNSDIKGIVIESPTREGIVSDIKKIAAIARARKIPLIVDESYGAHFDMHSSFPNSALSQGADIVIQSFTNPLLEEMQAAIIHYNSNLIDKNRLDKYISVFQTDKPSKDLLLKMDNCLSEIFEKGEMMFQLYVDLINKFREDATRFTHLELIDFGKYDTSKIYAFDKARFVIRSKQTGFTGKNLKDELYDNYGIRCAQAKGKYVVITMNVNDGEDEFNRLYEALTDIDRGLRIGKILSRNRVANAYSQNKKSEINVIENISTTSEFIRLEDKVSCFVPYEVDSKDTESILLTNSIGKVSAEHVYLDPPGILVIAPGELITENTVKCIKTYRDLGYEITGLQDINLENINVIKEDFRKVDITTLFGKKIFTQIDK